MAELWLVCEGGACDDKSTPGNGFLLAFSIGGPAAAALLSVASRWATGGEGAGERPQTAIS
jgi:hypothetical protein